MIKFENVNKHFGNFHALKDINLQFEEGGTTTIIGPSGSGKSTLLRTINGLETISSGDLFVFGDNLANASAKKAQSLRRHIGMVFQHFELYPHMTVQENVTLAPLKVVGVSKKEAQERAEKYLTQVNMYDRKDSYPNQLSGGQKQRVAIARCLAMKPRLMLFDEPTSALDPETIKDVLDVMKELSLQGEITMIIVTHEMGFAREVSDRTIFMADGHVVEDAPSNEFFDNPNSDRATDFINQVIAY